EQLILKLNRLRIYSDSCDSKNLERKLICPSARHYSFLSPCWQFRTVSRRNQPRQFVQNSALKTTRSKRLINKSSPRGLSMMPSTGSQCSFVRQIYCGHIKKTKL